MKALIVSSSREELTAFKDGMYIRISTGVGLSLAAVETARAIIEYSPDIVISVGSAGSMKADLEIGSILSFDSVYNKDQNLTAYHLPPFSTLKKDGSTLSGIRLIGDHHTLLSSSSFATECVDGFDAQDMECYSVALASSLFSIKCASFKLITDIIGQKTFISDYRRILRDGRARLEVEVRSFLKNI